MRLAFGLIVLITIAIVGCSDAADTAAPSSNSSGKPAFVFTADQADIYLVASQTRLMQPSGSYGEYQQQWTYFYTSTGGATTANAVTLNGQAMSVTLGSQAGSVDVSYDGAYHVWDVTGNSNVPTFKDSIASPTRFYITEPDTKVDTITKSIGFAIEYTSPGTDSVYIVIDYSPAVSNRHDSTAPTVSWRTVIPAQNTGTYTVTSSQLSGMPANGWMTVTVVAPKMVNRTVSGKVCALVSIASTMILVPFK